jgi:acyl carrier protein
MTNEEIYGRIRTTLIENFEIPAERISMDAKLSDDLELDSIDAIDMAVQIQELTGARLEEDELRKLRTVRDTVELVARLIAAKAQS